MSGAIINESTSVVQVISNGQNSIVYVSSTTIPGQLVTVIDATGYTSSPQYILLSSVRGTQILGTSSIQQRYGYVTLISQDTNTWEVVNANSFPDSNPITYRAVDAPRINVTTALAGYISTGVGNTTGVDIQSTMNATSLFMSTLYVNSYAGYLSTATQRATVIGGTKIYGSTITVGAFNVRGNISTGGDCFVGGNISSKLGTIYIGGDVTTSGSIRAQRGVQATVEGASSFSTATFAQLVTIGTNVTVGNAVGARGISTVQTNGQAFSAASSITFIGSNTIQYRPGFLNFANTPITVPSISSGNVTASNGMVTSNLAFQSYGSASTLRFLTMSTAEIANANGSLATSSIAGNVLQTTRMEGARMTASTIELTALVMNDGPASTSNTITYPPATSSVLGTVVVPMSWLISSTGTAGTLLAPNRSMSTNIAIADLVTASNLNTRHNDLIDFRANSMRITSTVFFSSATLFSLRGAAIINTGGSIRGTNTEIATYMKLSSIQTDLISTPGTVYFNGALNHTATRGIMSSVTSKTILTSSLAFTTANLGQSMAYSTINPSTPWLAASTFQMNRPPFTTTTGLGTYFDEVSFTAATDQTAYYSVVDPTLVATYLSTPYINTVTTTGKVIGQPASDKLNNLYYGENTIGWKLKKIDATGRITTVAGNYQYFYGDGQYPASAALGPRLAVSVVSPGQLLVTDCSNARLRFVDTQPIITTVAGNGQPGYSGDGGLAFNAVFNNPAMTVVDSASNVYVADSSNNMVRKITLSTITRYAGTGQPGVTGDGGAALSAKITPYGLAVNTTNTLYITDSSNCVIRAVSPISQGISRYAGNYTQGFSGDGGLATAAALSTPRALAVDPANNTYVCDTGNRRVRRIDGVSNIISTIAGNGTDGFTGDGGPGFLASLSSPTGITTDGQGNLYIADTNNNCIRFVNAQTGIITTVAGQGNRPGGYLGNNTFAVTALLSTPSHVAFDQSSGYYYIADDGNRRVRLVNSATGIIYDYVGNGSPIISDKLFASNAVFGSITCVATDLQNNVYIADNAANVIGKLDVATNTISTLVVGQISSPQTLITDTNNNLFFCDTNNHRVRAYYSTTRQVATIAGTGVAGYNGDAINASAAQLNYPKSLTIDRAGNLFIGDSSNYRIRRVDGGTGFITTVAGTGLQGLVSTSGSAVSTPIGFVTALTTDANNALYFTDIPSNGLWLVSTTFEALNRPSTASYLGDGGPLINAQFSSPRGLIYDNSGNFVVCDTGRLRRTYNYGLPQTPVYLNMNMTVGNYYATSGDISVSINGNVVANFDWSQPQNSTFMLTDTNIYNYPLQNSNPVLQDQTPYIQISQRNNTGYMLFKGTFWVNQIPGQGFLQNAVNGDAGIIMNSGTVHFPYQNNGITIQNKYNDASMRTVTYTGYLNSASDPALKEGIRAANLGICYQTLADIPLKHYSYIEPFCSTFHVRDRSRLGFLTSDVLPYFPNSVTTAPLEAWDSTIHTLDVGQIKFAHLGATQKLIGMVSTLEVAVAEAAVALARYRATQRNAIH